MEFLRATALVAAETDATKRLAQRLWDAPQEASDAALVKRGYRPAHGNGVRWGELRAGTRGV
jgi:hypothetical protein